MYELGHGIGFFFVLKTTANMQTEKIFYFTQRRQENAKAPRKRKGAKPVCQLLFLRPPTSPATAAKGCEGGSFSEGVALSLSASSSFSFSF